MLETKVVLDTFKELEESLLASNSSFMKFTKEHTLRGAELASVYNAMQKISIEAAIAIVRGKEELELKNREVSLVEEKTRQEIALGAATANAQLKIHKAEALKSLIQGEAMQRSIGDNAAINKSNAYVGFLNVAGNAEERAAIEQHSKGVVATINEINSKPTTIFNPLLDALRKDLNNVLEIENKEVFVLLPKVCITKGESIKVLGGSSFGNNACKFEIGDKVYSNVQTLYITGDNAGELTITFSVQNDKNAWVSDSVILKVKEN